MSAAERHLTAKAFLFWPNCVILLDYVCSIDLHRYGLPSTTLLSAHTAQCRCGMAIIQKSAEEKQRARRKDEAKQVGTTPPPLLCSPLYLKMAEMAVGNVGTELTPWSARLDG